MSNLGKLTSQIISEAEEKKKNILTEAQVEAENIIKKKEDSANILKDEIIRTAKIKAEIEKSRILSSASLEARNEKLKEKQNKIEEVFKCSVEDLASLDDTKYIAFLKTSILNLDIIGDEKLILNEKGKKLFDDRNLKDLNNSLLSQSKKGEIAISCECGNFKGGFILEKNGIMINCTFESLVESLKEELEPILAKKLFS